MKRNIFIRIVCLLLCVSMLTPVVASAAHTPPVITTNEMAYVDLFFLDDGGDSPLGDNLKKWLDMTPKVVANGNWEDSAERVGSGYLMLEQEIEHQATSGFYIFAERYIKGARAALDTVGSGGTNLISKASGVAGFTDKFPGAGKSAYPYYQYLYQFYLTYLDELHSELQKTDEAFKTFSEVVGDVIEATPEVAQDSANLYHDVKLAYVKSKKLDTITIIPENYDSSKGVKVVDVAAIDTTPYYVNGVKVEDVAFFQDTGFGELPYSFTDTMNSASEGQAVIYRISKKLEKNLGGKENALNLIDKEISKRLNINNAAKIEPNKMKTQYFEGCIDGMQKADGFSALPEEVQAELVNMNTADVPELNVKTKYAKVFDALEKVGKAADVASAGADVYSYFKGKANVTAQQLGYLNAAANVTRDYLDMLEAWYDSVDDTATLGQEDIKAALAAMMLDILNAQNATVDEIKKAAKDDAYALTFDSLLNAIFSVADTVADLCGAKDLWGLAAQKLQGKGATEAAKSGAASQLAAVMAVVSIGSAVLNAQTNRFAEFEQNSEVIYNMKASLWNVLEELLIEYRSNRSHKLAMAIICTLNTMKTAKIAGEGLVEEYYLYDMYHSLGIDPSGPVHLVLMSELMQWNGRDDLNVTDAITGIVTVYEDTAKIDTEHITDVAYRTIVAVDTKVLAYYLQPNEDYGRFKGIDLAKFPREFVSLSNEPPSYKNHWNFPIKYMETTIDEKWLAGQTVTNGNSSYNYSDNADSLFKIKNPAEEVYIMYKDPTTKLYSRNGIEVILTGEEYRTYLELQRHINKLVKKHNDPDEEIKFWDWNADEELQELSRLEWTILTKKWIERVEMYDASVDYIRKSKIYHLAWAQNNP